MCNCILLQFMEAKAHNPSNKVCDRIGDDGFCPSSCDIRTAIKNEEGKILYYTCHHRIANVQRDADGVLKALKDLQLWRYKAMNGVLKKDVWKIWNEETDRIDALRQQRGEP